MIELWRDSGGTKTAGFGQDKVGLSKLTPRSSRLLVGIRSGTFFFPSCLGAEGKTRKGKKKNKRQETEVGRLASSRL